jgi:hypothetical protein
MLSQVNTKLSVESDKYLHGAKLDLWTNLFKHIFDCYTDRNRGGHICFKSGH